jgi:LAS superfamily LD-carboxypeptidase LdcB
MKKITLLLTFCFLFLSLSVFSQELSRKEKNAAKKSARSEYKLLQEEGWQVFAGDPDLERQLLQLHLKKLEKNAEGKPKYLTASASEMSYTQNTALHKAMHQAKIVLANQIQQTEEMQASAGSSTQVGPLMHTIKLFRKEEGAIEVKVYVAIENK